MATIMNIPTEKEIEASNKAPAQSVAPTGQPGQYSWSISWKSLHSNVFLRAETTHPTQIEEIYGEGTEQVPFKERVIGKFFNPKSWLSSL
jgi:hypothetical protein